MRVSLEQQNVEIHANRRQWERKPLLRKVYSQFEREDAKRVDPAQPSLVVELGCGKGLIKEHLPDCITTDVFPNPWLHRGEDAYNLTFDACAVSNLIFFDVWHHLEYPGTALREFHWVLTERGKVIIFDPAMGVLGRFVFGAFHHEPLGLREEIRWEAPAGLMPADFGCYAAQGNASGVFGSRAFRERLRGWRLAEVSYFSALTYLGTGGFRGPQLYPMAALPLLNRVDSFLSRFPSLASRMLVVLEKQAQHSPSSLVRERSLQFLGGCRKRKATTGILHYARDDGEGRAWNAGCRGELSSAHGGIKPPHSL